jgi:hypothetical protein
MLAPQPLTPTTLTWPIAGDEPDLLTIVQAQALTVASQEALIDAYQKVLATAQLPPDAHGTGTATGTSLVMTAVTGVILEGAVVTGTGIPAAPPNTVILEQTAGTEGGNGTYTTSQATTATGAALTFSPGGGPSPWPVPRDPDTLNAIVQAQTAVIRNQTALLQQYQDLLNVSQTAAPPTGP